MTGLDWVLVVVTLLAAVGGATQGFLVSGLGLLGFAGGAMAGARIGPKLLTDGATDANAPLAAIGGALVGGVALGVLLQSLADRVRARVAMRPPGPTRGIAVAVDRVLGALLTTGLVVLAAWLLSGAVLQAHNLPPEWRSEVRRSAVLRELRRALPPARDALAILSRFDPLPGFAGPGTTVEAPDARVLRRSGVRAAYRGVVRIEGTACGAGIVGTGWVAGNDLVVTNHHVIAGEARTEVIPASGGEARAAHAVYSDPDQDIAILAVPGLDAAPLRMRDGERGTTGAILGYPGAGPFRARAVRVDVPRTVRGEDAYGEGPVLRSIVPFRGRVEQGNSGGPIVDRAGRVLGTVFASAASGDARAGYAVANGVVRDALTKVVVGRRVATGRCAH